MKDLTYDPDFLYSGSDPLSETVECPGPQALELTESFDRHEAADKGIASMPGSESIGEAAQSIHEGEGPYSNYDPGYVVFTYYNHPSLYVLEVDRYRPKNEISGEGWDWGLVQGMVHSYSDGNHNWSSSFKVDYDVSVYKTMVVASKTR